MANLDNVSDVFAGATVVGTTLTINNIDTVLPKFNQGDNVAEGAELIYALVDKLSSVVGAAGHSSLSTSTVNTFDQTNLTMTRNISIATTLDIASNLDNMDVKLDSSNLSQNLSLTSTLLGGGGDNVATQGTVDQSDDVDGDYIARLDLSVNGTLVDYDARYDYTITDSVSADSAKWSVTNDGTDWFLVTSDLAGLTAAPTTHTLTITVDDGDVDYPQEGAVATVSVNVTAQA